MVLIVNKPTFKDFKPIKAKIKNNKDYYLDKIKIKKIYFTKSDERFYLFKKNNINYFLKEINLAKIYSVKFLLSINKFLLRKKILVPKLKENLIKNKFKKKHYFLVFEHIKGRYIEFNNNNLKLFSIYLSNFHYIIKFFNLRAIIKKNTQKRINKLEKIRVKFLNNTKEYRKIRNYKKIYNIFYKEKNLILEYKKMYNFSQITHGDLVPGNIIFSNKNFFLLDFEDTHYSYFPIEFDIALVLERLILVKNISKKEKLKKIRFFLKNYLNNTKNKKIKISIIKSLKFISLRSLLMQISVFINGKEYSNSEISKFIQLYNKNIDFLKKIDDEFCE